MAYIKFNKPELVNLSYSLKREIICGCKSGAYCNTSIVTCNTRRYHGLLAVTLDRFGGDKYLLLSSMDETLVVGGKQFNLGIHCYGETYEPRGHKYVVDFESKPMPVITYKVGQVVFRKTFVLGETDRIIIKYELLEGPSDVKVILKPFLAFRNIHALTHRNDQANLGFTAVPGGASFNMYAGFPDLFLQMDCRPKYSHMPCWNMNITYSDEYRRGFDCVEDLFTPGTFEFSLKPGKAAHMSASLKQEKVTAIAADFEYSENFLSPVKDYRSQLAICADYLIINHNDRLRLSAGYSWMYSGLLRETLQALPGLALYGIKDAAIFEGVLDNLIADEQERLRCRTTQVEAPLYLACTLQSYIDWGAEEKHVWEKYGDTLKAVIESYLPGNRREVTMHPNGLLWAQMDGVALSWMNAYVDGRAVTERAGYQVETNAFWYNAIMFALEMEAKYGTDNAFVERWTPIAKLVKDNYTPTFFDERAGYLADYVDNYGRNLDVRPNQLYALWVKNSPIDEELHPIILRVVDTELVTARGIRTLSPRDVKYKGVYEGSQVDRDLAYHQGSTRPFLLEQYIDIAFRLKGPSFLKKAEWLTEGFALDMNRHGIGAFSELYDGDPPHEAHGAISSALSTAALLVVDSIIEKHREA